MKQRFQERGVSIVVLLTILLIFVVRVNSLAESRLQLNDKEYFESRGFDVLVFENEYNGMFFDEKTGGTLLIHHGQRTATGGAVRLKPTPEQWDQIPKVIERNVNRENNSIDVVLRYEDFEFDSRLVVQPEGESVRFSVLLDKPLPGQLEGQAGLNIEFLPSTYFEKYYLMDGQVGAFPRYPFSQMEVKPADSQLRQFAGHSTFDDRGRGEYVEPKPFAVGKSLVLAPDDPICRIHIESLTGDLMLLDGRSVAQNGWFVVRTLIPAGKTGTVVEWILTPSIIENWTRQPMIGHSQVGYVPGQQKRAIIELDRNDRPLAKASLLKLDESGKWIEKYSGDVNVWGEFLRYTYAVFDFSSVSDNGLYCIQYGGQRTGSFPIHDYVYDNIWQPTLDVWFPVQMDHMFVNEAYRVWHGAAHLDDARQAPTNHQHFDGFRQGDSTDTQYKVGEHIPGLNIGGWFDAGDYDIRTGSHCATVMHLVDAWEYFEIQRDETLVDQDRRFVDIHHPDGQPDLLQQIEQGTLALIAQHRAFGFAIQDIIVPELHQYHHLGDGSTMTDNLIYNPDLQPYETNGFYSGTPDDRWAFTNRSAGTNYSSIAAIAAASRALRGYNDELADECLKTAIFAWDDEHRRPAQDGRAAFFAAAGERNAALQLYLCTKDKKYADTFKELLWPGMERGFAWNMAQAVKAVPYLENDYKEQLRPYVEKFKASNDELLTENPFGVSISRGGWAGNGGIINWAITNYLLHKVYPDLIGPEYTYRGLDYIFGCHPTSNISFVSGVGRFSKTKAYGNNRADFSFIAGGVVPGVLILKPDFPENMIDWPFLWGENEYVIDVSAAYIMLGNAAQDLARLK